MNGIAKMARAVLCAALTLGVGAVTACGSDQQSSDARNVGTVKIPLSTTVGTSTYRLDAVFNITGQEGVVTLTTRGDEPALSTTLPSGAYDIGLESYTLSKEDGAGNFYAVEATVVANSLPFTVTANSTTTVSFHFLTDGVTVAPGTGNVDVTFDVTETGCHPITVDSTARTVQSARFFLDFSNAVAENPEDLDVLRWAGGPNLVESFAIDACSSNVVEHFGTSWAPPDPNLGGRVLVGSGSSGSWEQDGASIVIHSTSSGCSASTSTPVETRYQFRAGTAADTIEVDRQFDLGSGPVNQPFRPFMPRLSFSFDRVLHPDAAGRNLLSEDIFACPYGCQLSNWDGSWFAYYATSGPLAGHGMIVRRGASALPANLWLDYDAGITDTNSSSVLLLPPAGGFPAQVTEKELLCFFDGQSWSPAQQASLTLPAGCTLGLECDGSGTGEPSPCEPNPCQHGTCSLDGAGGYTCQCPPSITGRNCELTFTDVQVGQRFTCGLRSDGRVLCWGDSGADGVPSDTFRALSTGEFGTCGLLSDGEVKCWGYGSEGVLNTPSGTFDTIAAYTDYACALHDHVPTCWGDRAATYPVPDGLFSDIEIAHSHSCGIRLDGTIACWGADIFGESEPPSGAFRALSLSQYSGCGLRQSDGTLACWGYSFAGNPAPTGPLQGLDLDIYGGCGVGLDGNTTCWGSYVAPPPFGTYKKVLVYELRGTGIRTDDQLIAWGQNVEGEGTPPY